MKRYVLMFVESRWYSLNVDNFEEFNEYISYNSKNILITFQTSDLISHFKSEKKDILPTIIDLESFDKQMSQEGKEFREFKKWKAINFLRHHKVIEGEFEFKNDNFKFFLENLANLFLKLLEKDAIESARFESVETKINKLIYERQLLGVKVNIGVVEQTCNELEKEIYYIKNILQIHFNIFSPNDESQQLSYLTVKKFNIIKSAFYTFKVRRNDDEVCNLFYELIRSEQDLESLLYILSHWGGSERTYPSYLGFGSITSRIILRQPSLQNLRKTNRKIIVADVGMKLLYIDYSQFEAGILASLGSDDVMIKLYNSDIYEDLAEKIFKDKNKRSDAKILFYRYIYGDNSLNSATKAYFQKFKKLEGFRKKINKDISANRKIGTSNGNFRYCFDEEFSWSLSHVVQATASLIYKNALIRVHNEVPLAKMLIPMHDGTLYQIIESNYVECKEKIEYIYKEEFKALCPEIIPQIKGSELFE